MRRTKLDSDFSDYYDALYVAGATALDCPSLIRTVRSVDRPTKQQILTYLDHLGMRTPQHGLVKDLAPSILDSWPESVRDLMAKSTRQMVVYLPFNFSINGGHSLLMSCNEAMKMFPDHYASEFLQANEDGVGEAFRYVRVGRRNYWLRLGSADDWRATRGATTTELIVEGAVSEESIDPSPLFSIDTLHINEMHYSINFSRAPKLMGTGIDSLLPAADAAAELIYAVSRGSA